MNWDYLLTHAQDIMYLCIGVGFLLICIFGARFVYIGTRVLKKVDDLTDLFIEYIQRPLRFLIEAQGLFSKLLKWFKK